MSLASESPTSSLLDRYRELNRQRRNTLQDAITPGPPNTVVEASEAQQQLWLHGVLAGDAPVYNEPVTIQLNFDVKPSILEEAFNYVLRRHEAWRTGFEWVNGKLIQVISPELLVRIPLFDVSAMSAEEGHRLALIKALKDATSPIDTANPPLFRILLVRLADSEYRLYLTLHHIIFDGVSLYQVFLPELQTCYSAFDSGIQPDLSPLSIQFADYCWWEQTRPVQELSPTILRYWKERLPGNLRAMQLPLDHPRPALRSFKGAFEPFQVPCEVSSKLKKLAQACNSTPFVVFLAAFHALLYQWTGECDQLIGTVTSTRKHPEALPLLGFFLNTVVLRTTFTADYTFQRLLEQTRDTVVGALSHEVSYTSILKLFAKERSAGVNPLFQILFSLEPKLSTVDAAWSLRQMDLEPGTTKFDLSLEVDDRKESLIGRFIYSTEIFEEAAISKLTSKWIQLLNFVAEAPTCSLKELALQLSSESLENARSKPHKKIWNWIRGARSGTANGSLRPLKHRPK